MIVVGIESKIHCAASLRLGANGDIYALCKALILITVCVLRGMCSGAWILFTLY